MTYLLDTNVLSEIRKRRPDPRVQQWFASTAPHDLYLSVLVVGEIRQGVERLRESDPTRAASLDGWLAELVSRFQDRIVPVSLDVAQVWGRLNAADPLPAVDSLLAATALAHDWTLVSRNLKDMSRTGARLLNPFEPS